MRSPSCHRAVEPSERRSSRRRGRLRLHVALGMMCGAMFAQMAPSHPTTQPASPHGQMTVTQSGNPHGQGKSSLKTFAAECGVTEMSEVRVFVSGVDEKWREVSPTSQGDARDTNVARAWKDAEGNIRVVDFSKSNATGNAVQMSRACYSPKGSLRKVSEHYVNLPNCACGRTTEIAYADAVAGNEQGKQTKRTEYWYKMPSQEPMSGTPLKDAPAVLEYRSLAALPFANLLKGKNASSH